MAVAPYRCACALRAADCTQDIFALSAVRARSKLQTAHRKVAGVGGGAPKWLQVIKSSIQTCVLKFVGRDVSLRKLRPLLTPPIITHTCVCLLMFVTFLFCETSPAWFAVSDYGGYAAAQKAESLDGSPCARLFRMRLNSTTHRSEAKRPFSGETPGLSGSHLQPFFRLARRMLFGMLG